MAGDDDAILGKRAVMTGGLPGIGETIAKRIAADGRRFNGISSYARYGDAGYWIACLLILIICEGLTRHM